MTDIEVDGSVVIDTKIDVSGAKIGSEEVEKTLVGLRGSIKPMVNAVKDIPNIMKYAFSSASKSIKHMSPEFHKLQDEIDKYEDALYRAKKAGHTLGDPQYDKAYAGLMKAKRAAEEYKKKLLGVNTGHKKADKSGKKFNKTLKGTEKNSKGARMSMMRMLGTSILFSTVFRGLALVTSGMKEGMDNLSRYSNDTNKTMSALMSSMTKLKNSFATSFSPLIEHVQPAMTKFIDQLSQGVTYTGKLFAALTGKDYFVQAKDVQQDYADSLDKTKESAEKTQKQLASFDKLEVLNFDKKESSNTDKELKPEDMFETVQIEDDIKDRAEFLKKIFSSFFNPLRESWEDNGPIVMESLRNTLSEARQLAGDVGNSFMHVWNVERYGKAITDDLLITLANLLDTAGNIIIRFDEAWMSGERGTSMLRHTGNIILEISGFLRKASEELKIWSSDLDFSPLLASMDNVLEQMRPIVGDAGDIVLWLLRNVLLPLTKWGLENGIPAAFDLIAAALETVHAIIVALEPSANWLWDLFLQPLGRFTGKVIIAALHGIAEALRAISNWIREHQAEVENITIAVIAFFAAWKFTVFVAGIIKMVSGIKMLSAVLSVLGIDIISILTKIGMATLKFTLLTAAISGIVAVVTLLAKNWNYMSPSEKVVAGILAAAAAVGILAVALGAVKGGIAATIVAGALSAGILAATAAINAGRRQVASSYSSNSGKSRSGYSMATYAAVPYNVPRLATGTVVPPRAGEFAAILGDNNRETEVVSPLSTMKQALKEALLESGINGGAGDITLNFTGDLAQLARVLKPVLDKESSRVGVRLVTGGGNR